jgi:hypothetical protein
MCPIRLVSCLLVAGCASSGAPAGFQREARVAQSDARGGWASVELAAQPGESATRKLQGELIAATEDALILETPTQAGSSRVRLARAEIRSARVTGYETTPGSLVAWGTLGALSTLSHGFILIFSAPVWIVATSASAAVESRGAMIDYPDSTRRTLPDGSAVQVPLDLSAFAMYARFPQGAPGPPAAEPR